MQSQHFISFNVDWASPVLMMCVAAVFLIAIQKIFSEQLQKWGFSLQSRDIEVDEDLPPFLTTVKLTQADELI
jgi:hypothetical protein